MKPESLVRRLIWLAAGWSLALLAGTGVALSLFFSQAAISRFDQGLLDVADALYAGSTVDEKGGVVAPALTDARALRAYSGKYWQIAEPAHRLDAILGQLLAQPADEHLDGVGVAVEILVVEVLHQFGAADHPPLVQHHVV